MTANSTTFLGLQLVWNTSEHKEVVVFGLIMPIRIYWDTEYELCILYDNRRVTNICKIEGDVTRTDRFKNIHHFKNGFVIIKAICQMISKTKLMVAP